MKKSITIALVAASVLLAGAVGSGIGAASVDPTQSQQYLSLSSERDGLKETVDKAGDLSARSAAVDARDNVITRQSEDLKTREANVSKREEAVKQAEATKLAGMIKEGTWTVGVNIEPGTYRTEKEVSGSCYWSIYVSGTNGADIIQNDIVSGGQPTVTLSAGQDFKSSRCGMWVKVK